MNQPNIFENLMETNPNQDQNEQMKRDAAIDQFRSTIGEEYLSQLSDAIMELTSTMLNDSFATTIHSLLESGVSLPDALIELKSINDEDLLSQLADDCLRDILARVDHNDLDQVASLSRRMRRISAISRSKAIMLEATSLIVEECEWDKHPFPREFSFQIKFKGELFFLRITNSRYGMTKKLARNHDDSFRGYSSFYACDSPQASTASIMDRAAGIVYRFDFKSCIFDSVTFDNQVLDFMEQVTSSPSLNSIILQSCALKWNLDSNGKERFLSTLLTAKPAKMEMDFACSGFRIPFINDKFLEEYVPAAPLAEIELTCQEEGKSLLQAGSHFADALSEFRSLRMARLVVNVNWLLGPLVKRIRHKLTGTWNFRITRAIDHRDVVPYLEPDLMNDQSGSMPRIFIFGSSHHVVINQVVAEGGKWLLWATFQW